MHYVAIHCSPPLCSLSHNLTLPSSLKVCSIFPWAPYRIFWHLPLFTPLLWIWVLDSTPQWDHTVHFCTGFTLFNVTPSRVIKVWYRVKGLLLFWGWVVLCSLSVRWSAGYIWLGWPHLGYCEQCWSDHGTGEHSCLFTSFLRDDLPYPREISDSLCSQGNSEPPPSTLLCAGITGACPAPCHV